MRQIVVICLLSVMCGCSGGGGGGQFIPVPVSQTQKLTFWVYDFAGSEPSQYQITARKVAEGQHCYIFLEEGSVLSSTAINTIMRQFDENIHPVETSAFGNDPDPGIDGDPKVYLLLHTIRDGFSPETSQSYLAGYFKPADEYARSSQNPNSNEKEILYLNINPATGTNTTGVGFFSIIAHEFQHLIYWEQKVHRLGIEDPPWLLEAMAVSSRFYCGYGPDYGCVYGFESDPDHSLTGYEQSFGYYGMVYLWAQYLTDRYGTYNIFRRMMENNATGIASVNAALASIPGNTKDFTAVFRDWAVANFFGNGSTVAPPQGHPEWSYTSINTWPDTYSFDNGSFRVTLPGLFPSSRRNVTALRKLSPWGLSYYSYTPENSGKTTGVVSWNFDSLLYASSFIDADPAGLTLTFTAMPGGPYTFTSTGYLIVSLPSSDGSASSGGTAIQTDFASPGKGASIGPEGPAPGTPREILSSIDRSPSVRRFVQETGKPRPVHADSFFFGMERTLRTKGLRPPF
jgi:hypothetical protein